MKLLPLDKLGAREVAGGVVEFGIFLPWVSASDGNQLWVKIIHEQDQFLQDIAPNEFELTHSIDPEYGNYWSVRVDIKSKSRSRRTHPNSTWGKDGKYVYRYCLRNSQNLEIDWLIDPFAREFGIGWLSAFTLRVQDYSWSRHEEKVWKTPALNELIVYKLLLGEFDRDIDKAIYLLDYLADLGINCIEVIPVSNVSTTVAELLPTGYFGLDEQLGEKKDLQRLIDAAHQRKMAVVLDVFYSSKHFPYFSIYQKLGYRDSFSQAEFGKNIAYQKFIQDFFLTVNYYWLDYYHVDGFRYGCVSTHDLDDLLGKGYADLTFNTYQTVKAKQDSRSHWQRFFHDGDINIIQCIQQSTSSQELFQTYSNCAWQSETLATAQGVAHEDRAELTNLGFWFGLAGYPVEIANDEDKLTKTALQYIEDYNHPRFICNFGMINQGEEGLPEGDRRLWYKVQPYLIGMFTAKGIPMLWQGQELGENHDFPEPGLAQVMPFCPIRWDFFYDAIGKGAIALVRKLIKLRRQQPQFRYGDHFFYNNYDRYQSQNILLFSRQYEDTFSLVALNFGDSEQSVPFWFPISGDYREELHGIDNLSSVPSYQEYWLTLPSNYGRIWTSKASN